MPYHVGTNARTEEGEIHTILFFSILDSHFHSHFHFHVTGKGGRKNPKKKQTQVQGYLDRIEENVTVFSEG